MFLITALVLLSVGVGFFMSIYSSFFPFMQNISSITQYDSAYYSALGSVERASLVLKYRDPGFEGSGGFLGSTGWGPLSDQELPFLTDADQGMRWIITSRTTSIPIPGEGDTDVMLQAPDSDMYNRIGYAEPEIFPLSVDAVTGKELYYSGDIHNLADFSGAYVSGAFRLPPVVYQLFGSGPNALLCATGIVPCTPSTSGIYDKEVVARSLSGSASGEDITGSAEIIPTRNVFHEGETMYVNYPYDNVVRASVINDAIPLLFASAEHSFTPIAPNGISLTGHHIIPAVSGAIQHMPFGAIFQSSQIQNLRLSFSLASWLLSYQGSLYPYLEYRLTFPHPVSDRFFTIDAHGRNRDYDVQILLKKPTVPGTAGGGGGFTVIF